MGLKLPSQDQQARGELAPPLPTGLAPRLRGWAWVFSFAAHGFLLVLGLWGFERAVEEPPPTIRLVFVEPPPPSPPPLGAPEGKGSTPVPQKPPPIIEKPEEKAKPKRKEPNRLKVIKEITKQQASQPEPESATLPELGVMPESNSLVSTEPQSGIATGSVGGGAGGVVGGVEGGLPGGVVGGKGTGPVAVEHVTRPPMLISRVVPEYPQLARLQGIEGLVRLEAILDREGRVEENIKVLRSIPPLDEAAIKALRQWRFQPARDHVGQPVRVILEVPIRFVLR